MTRFQPAAATRAQIADIMARYSPGTRQWIEDQLKRAQEARKDG